jgi:hypothetical protein
MELACLAPEETRRKRKMRERVEKDANVSKEKKANGHLPWW